MATAQQMIPTDVASALRYGPQAQSAIMRSRYLADALKSLQESGQNISTPTELWTKLLATAVTSWGRDRADTQAVTALKADQDRESAAALADLGTPASTTPAAPPVTTPAPAAPANTASDPPPANPGSALAPPPPPPPPTGPVPVEQPGGPARLTSQADRDALALAMATEARSEGDKGELAVGNVVLNRLNKGYGGAKSVADVVNAPHQFPGIAQASRLRPQDMSHAQQLADALLSGQAGPDQTGGAINYLNPSLMAQWGKPLPAWAPPGQGQTIGQHVFYGGHPGAVSGNLPGNSSGNSGPTAFQQAALTGGELGPLPPPSQGAQPPPQSMPSAAGPPPVGPSGMAPGASLPQASPGASTTLPPTPEQIALAQRWLAQPATHDQGLAYARKLAADAAERQKWTVTMQDGVPVWSNPYKPGEVYVGQVPPQLRYSQESGGTPSAVKQTAPNGKVDYQTIPGKQGAMPEGTVFQNGAIVALPQASRQTFRIQGAPGLYITGPGGAPQKVADDEYGPAQIAELRNTVLKSSQYADYDQSRAAYEAMVANAGKPNGMSAYAMRDTFARAINPGAVARQGTLQAIHDASGVPESVKSFFLNLKGDGNVSPELAQQILNATLPFVQAHYRGVAVLNQGNLEYAKRHNVNPDDIVAPIGAMPQAYVLSRPAAVDPHAALILEAKRRGLVQ